MAIAQEVQAALGCLTVWRRGGAGASRQALAGGLAFYPLIGLAIGAAAAAVAAVIGALVPSLAGVAGTLMLDVLSGGRPRRGLAAAANALGRAGDTATVLARLRAPAPPGARLIAFTVLGAKAWAASALPGPGRTVALVLAPMLGRWAIVVQCHGGAPIHARGPAAAIVGRARFREFASASLVAFAVTLSSAQAVGLLVLIAAALVTVGVRVYAHRRLGGVTGRLLAATSEMVETVALILLALLARRLD